jgi:hypothetical protein
MVKFFIADYTSAPANQVVLEDTFVQLVENIRGEAGKYVGMW